MNSIATLLLAFATTVLCISILRPLAPKIGIVDHPTDRKNHEGTIPLVGGVAIWVALAVTLLFVGLTSQLVYLLVASGLLAFVGAADDAAELPATLRLILHIGIAVLVSVGGGIAVYSLGEPIVPGYEIALGLLAVPFTVFAIVALVNAVNMSDGLDGLCGMQSFIPLVGLTVLAGITGDEEHFLPLVAICGCLAGFLSFNLRTPWRRKATVFLGDAGSNLLGLILAWFLIDMSQGEGAILAPVAVLWFVMLLIYDTVEVVARRIVRRKSPFQADREHLHHVFLLARFSVSETVLTMSAITLIGVLIGMTTTFFDILESALFGAFILFGLLFLRMILRTWAVMQFLYRSICRRRGERRKPWSDTPVADERRNGKDRRGEELKPSREER